VEQNTSRYAENFCHEGGLFGPVVQESYVRQNNYVDETATDEAARGTLAAISRGSGMVTNPRLHTHSTYVLDQSDPDIDNPCTADEICCITIE